MRKKRTAGPNAPHQSLKCQPPWSMPGAIHFNLASSIFAATKRPLSKDFWAQKLTKCCMFARRHTFELLKQMITCQKSRVLGDSENLVNKEYSETRSLDSASEDHQESSGNRARSFSPSQRGTKERYALKGLISGHLVHGTRIPTSRATSQSFQTLLEHHRRRVYTPPRDLLPVSCPLARMSHTFPSRVCLCAGDSPWNTGLSFPHSQGAASHTFAPTLGLYTCRSSRELIRITHSSEKTTAERILSSEPTVSFTANSVGSFFLAFGVGGILFVTSFETVRSVSEDGSCF